nr:glycoside hydrolase family 38 C-terminal domain-containing protein [Bacillus pumilus]
MKIRITALRQMTTDRPEITDKQTGRTFSEQMIFEDNGDDGDSYNYSPPREDLYVSSKAISSADITVSKSGLQEELTVQTLLLLSLMT